MKYIKILILIVGLICSCTESYIDGYEISPNKPLVVKPSSVLIAAEVAVFGNVTGEIARVTSMWMQSQAGLSDQSKSRDGMYRLFEADNTNDFNSMYNEWMEASDDLINLTNKTSPYYAAMGMVLKGWSAAYISDIWGDMPFKEALLGDKNMNPKYDTQAEIYTSAQKLWDEALVLFEKKKEENEILPGSDDIIFDGDIEKWKTFTYLLKARYANRISKKDPNSAINVLKFLNDGELVIADGGKLPSLADVRKVTAYARFGEKANNANQWYAFYLKRRKYMGMGQYLVERLKKNNDPRLSYYSAKNEDDEYIGASANTNDKHEKISEIGLYLNQTDQPVAMASFEEALFLASEAALRKGEKENAAKYLNQGIKVSILNVTGKYPSDVWSAKHANFTKDDIDLKIIIEAKYDALFSQVEVWSDWRRTGYPDLIANADPKANENGIPYRLVTPINERLYNTNAVVVPDPYEKPYFCKE